MWLPPGRAAAAYAWWPEVHSAAGSFSHSTVFTMQYSIPLVRLSLLCTCLLATEGALATQLQPEAAVPEATLTIGAPAPAIDIADWIHPGIIRPVKPLSTFQPGTIYVLEFWATWCEYSREAMPLLAALQRRHGPDVVIIGIGVDAPESIRGMLTDGDPDVRELAAHAGTYCLAADPDGSVYEDYMDAILENGLPTAFVIGRTGLVEWIGHPLDMEEPLGRIVDGSWNRDTFATRWSRLQSTRQAVAEILALLAADQSEAAAVRLDRFVVENASDALMLNEVAWMIVERCDHALVPKAVLAAAGRAAARSTTLEPDSGNMLDTLAHVQTLQGDLHMAIATQRRAVEQGGKDAERFAIYLRQLEARNR